MRQSSATNLIVLLITMVICLGLLEFVLRYYLPADMDTTWDLRIPHPEYGWSLKPGARYQYRMATDMVEVEYNSRGYRDQEHTFDNPAATSRIVVLGDSFMESFSVENNEAFHSQMEAGLAAAGRPVEVINLGVGGYGTLQEYLVYQQEGRRYRPEIVVLGFYFGNDLRNNSLELEAIINTGSIKVSSRPFLDHVYNESLVTTPVDYAGATQRYRDAQSAKDTLFHYLASKVAILRAVELVLSRLLASGPGISDELAQKQDFVSLGMHYCEEPAEFTRAWDITRQLLLRLNHAVRADGAKLVIFTVTAEHEVDAGVMNRIIEDFADPGALCLDVAPAYQRLATIAGELGIRYINLLPDFRRRAQEGERFYLADRHWNAAGHALAAERVATLLAQ